MQIVIDIPDTVWNEAKEYGHLDICGIELSEKVMNGIPLPKVHGRLIDADELIKKLEVIANDEWNKKVGLSKGLEDAIEIIDDTPTIIKADLQSAYDCGYNCGYADAIKKILQTGKWIELGNEGLVFKCNLCGIKNTIESHFCPDCGAKMAESEENT